MDSSLLNYFTNFCPLDHSSGFQDCGCQPTDPVNLKTGQGSYSFYPLQQFEPSTPLSPCSTSSLSPSQTAEFDEILQFFYQSESPHQVVPQLPAPDDELSNSSEFSSLSSEIDAIIEAQIMAYQSLRNEKPQRRSVSKIPMTTGSDGSPQYHYDQLTFPNVELLRTYLQELGLDFHVCGFCGQVLKRPEHLYRHKKTAHGSERPFACTICGKSFKRKEHVASHSVIHSSERAFPCTICGKRFKRKDHMRKHERTHANKWAKNVQIVVNPQNFL